MSVSLDGSTNGTAQTSGSSSDWDFAGDFTTAVFFKTTDTGDDFMFCARDGTSWWYNAINDTVATDTTFSFRTTTTHQTQGTAGSSHDGAWHSFVVIRSSGTTTMYLDNVALPNTVSDSGGIAASNKLYVGCLNGNTNRYVGKLAKLLIYNSVAWSAGDITNYHNSGGTTVPSSPQVRYNYASSVALLTDSSGNLHTLVPNGTGLGFVYDTDEPPGGASGSSLPRKALLGVGS